MTPKEIPGLYRKYGSLKAIARAKGLSWTVVNNAYKKAVEGELMPMLKMGRKSKDAVQRPIERAKALKTKKRIPPKGVVHRWIITSAQNNTNLHEKTWNNLMLLAAHYKAKVLVSPFLYYKRGLGSINDKAQLSKRRDTSEGIWYDPRIVPYICKDRVEIAKGLVFCGELQILPTAADPLSGLEVYTGRKSMIVPHVRQDMESVPTLGGSGAKLNYCTGTVTLRNYIQAKAGLKAEFHHCYGGLIVEVDHDGHWYVRQLNADSDGVIYDWDLRVDGKVTTGNRVEAVQPGDIHKERLKPSVYQALWGKGGVVEELQPRYQFIHDLLDFHRRGHHDVKDPIKMYERFARGQECVRTEVLDAARFLSAIKRKDCETVVVDSNHDRHIMRWLTGVDGRKDPINYRFWLQMQDRVLALIDNTKNFVVLQEAMRVAGDTPPATFIDSNTSFVICKEHGGGIECAMHGDLPFRAGVATFSRMGRRSNTGHGHTAFIKGGAFRAGKSCEDRMGYNDGASSWSDTLIVTYPNSKRTLVTIYNGKARA